MLPKFQRVVSIPDVAQREAWLSRNPRIRFLHAGLHGQRHSRGPRIFDEGVYNYDRSGQTALTISTPIVTALSRLFGTDTGFLTDYDVKEEYRQLELAGLSFHDVLAMLTTSPAPHRQHVGERQREHSLPRRVPDCQQGNQDRT